MRIVFLLLLAISCSRAPLKEVKSAMRPYDGKLNLSNQFSFKSFKEGLEFSIERLGQIRREYINFGDVPVKRLKYIEALKKLAKIQETEWDNVELLEEQIRSIFHVYEVYGDEDWGDVLVTGYYTPVIEGSKRPTKKFTQALYKKPDDMVIVKAQAYRDTFDNFDIKADGKDLTEMRGRIAGGYVYPYFSREDIDAKNRLKGKKLEIAWVDPLEAFFLQIQGSGKVSFDGKNGVYLHYSDQNGHSYHPIGRELLGVIPLEEMSMQRIKEHLRSLPEKERDEILFTNPSYVFFKTDDERPKTYIGTQVISERTIATDSRYFPKGVLAFLKFEKESELASRLVFDHDRGGAIRGGGRVDLYIGEGVTGGQKAGGLKERAKLFYFVPKEL